MKRRNIRKRTPERKSRNKKSGKFCKTMLNSIILLVLYSCINILFNKNDNSLILQMFIITTIFTILHHIFKVKNNKNFFSNKVIEFVISWYLYKFITNDKN